MFQSKGRIIITKENEPSFRIPDESVFNSGVNTEYIFILCGSNDRLRAGFEAVACVEIRKVANKMHFGVHFKGLWLMRLNRSQASPIFFAQYYQ